MTPWLLPENRAALLAVLPLATWPSASGSSHYWLCYIGEWATKWMWGRDLPHEDAGVDHHITDHEAESILNTAALAWLRQHSEHASLTILLSGEQTITEQIIEEVNAWLEEAAQ